LRTPTCAPPLAPPPARTRPMRGLSVGSRADGCAWLLAAAIAAQLQSIRHAKEQANREQKYWHDIGSPAVRHAHGEERYCGSRGRCCGSRILRDR
jgi:hypothetical protein